MDSNVLFIEITRVFKALDTVFTIWGAVGHVLVILSGTWGIIGNNRMIVLKNVQVLGFQSDVPIVAWENSFIKILNIVLHLQENLLLLVSARYKQPAKEKQHINNSTSILVAI